MFTHHRGQAELAANPSLVGSKVRKQKSSSVSTHFLRLLIKWMHVSESDTKDNKGKENDFRSPGNNTVLNFVPLCASTKFTKQKITKEAKALKKESLFPSVYQKSIGTRGDDASSASRVNANRYVHPHARLEVRNRSFLSIHIDLGERSHNERSRFLLSGHGDRV